MNNIVFNSLSTLRPTASAQAPAEPRATAVEEVGAVGTSSDAARSKVELPASSPPETTAQDLKGAVEQLNGFMQAIKRELQFSIDDSSGRTVIKVIDSETQEIVRQIPPEQVEQMLRELGDGPGSLLPGVRA